MKLNIEKYLRPEFVFGPLYTGNTKALENAKKEIQAENRKEKQAGISKNILQNGPGERKIGQGRR